MCVWLVMYDTLCAFGFVCLVIVAIIATISSFMLCHRLACALTVDLSGQARCRSWNFIGWALQKTFSLFLCCVLFVCCSYLVLLSCNRWGHEFYINFRPILYQLYEKLKTVYKQVKFIQNSCPYHLSLLTILLRVVIMISVIVADIISTLLALSLLLLWLVSITFLALS